MNILLDIHTHRNPLYREGIICSSPADFAPTPGQFYSLGIHPWHIPNDPTEQLARLANCAPDSRVLAIGETGFDSARGSAMWLQSKCFKAHVAISEELKKPLIVHCVKCADMIVALSRELKPQQPWIIHGFRGKPSVAKMLLDAGCYLSFGQHFNPESLRFTPAERILAETDDNALLNIHDVIAALSEARGQEMLPIIEMNISRIFRVE